MANRPLPTQFLQGTGALGFSQGPVRRRSRLRGFPTPRLLQGQGGLGPLTALPPGFPEPLPTDREPPVNIDGVIVTPLQDQAEREDVLRLRSQLEQAKTISIQAAFDPESEGYQEAEKKNQNWQSCHGII